MAVTGADRRCPSEVWAAGRRPCRKRDGKRSMCGMVRKVRCWSRWSGRWCKRRTEGRVSAVPETLVVFREEQADGTWKHDYLLSNEVLTTTVEEWARVYKAQHRIEEMLHRAKGQAGLADYQVRTWEGWHHHQTLALIATWFLTEETRRKKNPDAGADGPAGAEDDRPALEPSVRLRPIKPHRADHEPSLGSQRASAILSLETTQLLAAPKV